MTKNEYTYTYLGDKLTRPELKGAQCNAVRDERGKCIRDKLGKMFVEFEGGDRHAVIGRMLRKNDKMRKAACK